MNYNANPPLRIAIAIPSSGPAGLFGPSAASCAQFAVHQLNQSGGILDREISLISVDGGQAPTEVATVLRSLIENKLIDAVVGMHDSDVLRAIVEVCRGKIPFVYTAPYEGGEQAQGFFCVGETADQQLGPAVERLTRSHHVNSWYLIGNDYSWPRGINRHGRKLIGLHKGTILAENYLPFGLDDYAELIGDLADRKPDCVLVSLIGNDSVAFNRAFAEAGLDSHTIRFGPLMEENTLLAIGAENTSRIYSTSSYVASLQNAQNKRFRKSYRERFGAHAPTLTFLGEACHEGIVFLGKIASAANSLEVEALESAAEGFEFESPRGIQTIQSKHAVKDIHFTRAEGLSFVIEETFPRVFP